MNRYYYLPRCCRCWWDNGEYVVGHNEHDPGCRHEPSGGHGGHQDGTTKCNRIIGRGHTRARAIADAREVLGLVTD